MSSEPSDWDPLPELGAAQYPGEAAALGPRQPASATAASAAPTAPAAPTLTLAAMMQAGPAPARREPAAPARRIQPAAATPVVAPPRIAVPLPGLRDVRENEPWFRALPAAEQERLQKAWARELQTPPAKQAHRQELLEWFWVAYVVFFVAAMPLMLVEGLAGFVRMAMAGCVTGMVWQMVPRTRLWCVVSAVAVYFAIAVVPRVGELAQSPFDALVSLGGACIVGYLASLALNEELHRPTTA